MYNEPNKKSEKRHIKVGKGDASKGILQVGAGMSAHAANEEVRGHMTAGENEEEEEEAQLSVPVAIFTLVWSAALVGVCAGKKEPTHLVPRNPKLTASI